MSQWLRVFAACSLIALVALLACDSSPTVTSPTQLTGSNRISGTFQLGTSSGFRLTAGTASTFDGITVSDKRNPSHRVEVRSNGTFTLEHVPGGTVTLVFLRDGRSLGEVTIQGVGSDEIVRLLLELTADDDVVLIDIQRASDDDASDDASEDTDLELDLDPDEWCAEKSDDDSSDSDSSDDDSSDDDSSDGSSSDDGSEDSDGVVFVTIKGSAVSEVNLASIRMVGPGGEVAPSPSNVALKSDRIEVTFDMAVAMQVVSGVSEGQRVTITITGSFEDGTSWELTESIRITCDDDSDDSSSG